MDKERKRRMGGLSNAGGKGEEKTGGILWKGVAQAREYQMKVAKKAQANRKEDKDGYRRQEGRGRKEER